MDNQESSGVGVPPGTVQAIALSELEPKRLQASQAPAAEGGAVLNALRNVKVKLTVCVGSAELTVGELLRVRAQQVIELDQAVEAPVELLLEGQVVARGALVAVEDHFGVRIEELPVPLELPHAGPKVG